VKAFQQDQEQAQNSPIIFGFDLNKLSMKKLSNIQISSPPVG